MWGEITEKVTVSQTLCEISQIFYKISQSSLQNLEKSDFFFSPLRFFPLPHALSKKPKNLTSV